MCDLASLIKSSEVYRGNAEICAENVYKDRYTFLPSYDHVSNTGPIALVAPAQAEKFYGELMDYGLMEGAMIAFEVDFMDYQYLEFPDLASTVGLAEQWQEGIGKAAATRNITVQLCMQLPCELMASLSS